MLTIVLLIISNVFMTFAWYGHLGYKDRPLWLVILVSWLIAFFEYCFQVPANRYGHGTFSAGQLKILQEGITIAVFSVFCVLYLRERLTWNFYVAALCMGLGFFFLFAFRAPEAAAQTPENTQVTTSREDEKRDAK